MRYGVLGTGNVAHTIADKLIALGHEVMMGARSSNNGKAAAWVSTNGERAHQGTFADAARFGERVFNCVQGIHSVEALRSAGAENLKGKILIDQSNPYIHRNGHTLIASEYDGEVCLGEANQALLPQTKVVKTLNYLHYGLMTRPQALPDSITGFYCGNDAEAKAIVARLLHDFGWKDTFDLGDISMSRYTEMLGAFWVPLYNQLGHMEWGFKLVR